MISIKIPVGSVNLLLIVCQAPPRGSKYARAKSQDSPDIIKDKLLYSIYTGGPQLLYIFLLCDPYFLHFTLMPLVAFHLLNSDSHFSVVNERFEL